MLLALNNFSFHRVFVQEKLLTALNYEGSILCIAHIIVEDTGQLQQSCMQAKACDAKLCNYDRKFYRAVIAGVPESI